MQTALFRPVTPSSPISVRHWLRRIRGLLVRGLSPWRRGGGVRVAPQAPAGRADRRPASARRPRVTIVPPMPPFEVRAARTDLGDVLDQVPAARRVFPSLALLERALGTHGGEGIQRVEACVLRHAAQSLDQLGDDWYTPGLVVLRRRLELILRRRHGDVPSHRAPLGLPPPGFVDTLTEFMDIDRPLRGHPPVFVPAHRPPVRPDGGGHQVGSVSSSWATKR